MKKAIIIFLVVIGSLAVLAYVGASFLLKQGSRQVMDYVTANARSFNMDIGLLEFGDAKPSSFNSVTWKSFAMRFHLLKNGAPDLEKTFLLKAEDVTAALNLSTRILTITGRGVRVNSGKLTASDDVGASVDRKGNSVEGDYFKVDLTMDSFEPTAVMRQARQLSKTLLDEVSQKGATSTPFDFTGRLLFWVGNIYAQAGLRVEEKNRMYALLLDKGDLRRLSDSLTEKLNEAEIDFLSGHPVQAPRLLGIKEHAQDTARQAHQQDINVPEDAYRHVLWNYLLAKEFGGQLAKEVTDAHERGDLDNTEADHEMDYHNNAVGRRYATIGYSEDKILDLVLTDPDVVRGGVE